jgi:hypothetical protein
LIAYPNFTVEEGDHVMVQRYEWPPRLFFNPEQWIPFFGVSILAVSHKLIYRPQLTVVTKLLPRGLALHAPVPFHGLFSKSHGLENQVSHHEDFGGGDVAPGLRFELGRHGNNTRQQARHTCHH